MDSIDTQELQEPDSQDSKTDRASRRNSLGRLKDRLKAIDKLIHDSKTKAGKREDLCIQASEIERLLWQADRDDKADKTLAQLATLTAEVTRLSEENARLTQANAALTATRTKALEVQPERIPDSVLQEQVRTLEALLQSVATLARGVDVDARTRHAVSLIVEHGKRAMSVVEEMGVSFSSVVTALQKSETELLGLLQQAQQEGPALPVYRAVLSVRDSVQVDRHGKKHYPDVFDDGYAKEL